MSQQLLEEIERRFKHYPPQSPEEIKMHEFIRENFKNVAQIMAMNLPDKVTKTREFSQVLTDLENAMMHANAAYARHKND